MRYHAKTIVATAWLSGFTLFAAERPNVLLIMSDDHSAAHVGCYGNKDVRTPNLDAFATQGVRLDRAYVSTPQCVPSRATYVTGRGPIDINMTRFSAPLPASVPALPDLLRAEGYYSGICGRTFHLDGSGSSSPNSKAVLDKHHLRTFAKRVDFLRSSNQKTALPEMVEFLGQVPAGKPFFLWMGFNDPHRPLDRNAVSPPHDPAKLTLPPHYPDTPAVREDFARYYDEISRMDGLFGEVMSKLRQLQLETNTLVVFVGDNGASQLRGKGTLYEFGVRVPWLMRLPGVIKPGTVLPSLISGEDLAPTILQAAGTTPLPEMTGRSFWPALTGGAYVAREFVFAQRSAHGSALPKNSAAFDLGRCVIGPRYKFIYNALWQLPYTPVDFNSEPCWKELESMHAEGRLAPEMSRIYFSPTRPMFELYDLQNDPAEMRNLAGEPATAGTEQQLRGALEEWMILQRDYVPLPGGMTPRNRPNRSGQPGAGAARN
jgi:N-sulfoglucosamine sulfohydrolase